MRQRLAAIVVASGILAGTAGAVALGGQQSSFTGKSAATNQYCPPKNPSPNCKKPPPKP